MNPSTTSLRHASASTRALIRSLLDVPAFAEIVDAISAQLGSEAWKTSSLTDEAIVAAVNNVIGNEDWQENDFGSIDAAAATLTTTGDFGFVGNVKFTANAAGSGGNAIGVLYTHYFDAPAPGNAPPTVSIIPDSYFGEDITLVYVLGGTGAGGGSLSMSAADFAALVNGAVGIPLLVEVEAGGLLAPFALTLLAGGADAQTPAQRIIAAISPVLYTAQTLTSPQKTQALANIGAASVGSLASLDASVTALSIVVDGKLDDAIILPPTDAVPTLPQSIVATGWQNAALTTLPDVTLYFTGTDNDKPYYTNASHTVYWDGVLWTFIYNDGVDPPSVWTSVDDTTSPDTATFYADTNADTPPLAIPAYTPAEQTGQFCRYGNASPYLWFVAEAAGGYPLWREVFDTSITSATASDGTAALLVGSVDAINSVTGATVHSLNDLYFEGTTAQHSRITHANTGVRDYTFPDRDGTVLVVPADTRNNLIAHCPIKDGPVPFVQIFEDFPHGANGGSIGTHGWTPFRDVGSNGVYAIASSTTSIKAWGIQFFTTGSTSGNYSGLLINSIPSSTPLGSSQQVCFASASTTSCAFYVGFAGAVTFINAILDFTNSSLRFEATGVSSINLLTGLSLSAGDFVSGKRYRLYLRCISATSTEVYLAESSWDGTSWTTLYDSIVTHSAITLSPGHATPRFFILTNNAAAKTAYVDWAAVANNVQR